MSEETTRQQDEVDLETPAGKLKVRGSDMLGILQLMIICIIAYGGWQHISDAKADTKALAEAIKENTKAQQQQVAVQREANCLNRLQEKEKTAREIEFCKQLGKEH